MLFCDELSFVLLSTKKADVSGGLPWSQVQTSLASSPCSTNWRLLPSTLTAMESTRAASRKQVGALQKSFDEVIAEWYNIIKQMVLSVLIYSHPFQVIQCLAYIASAIYVYLLEIQQY